VLAHAFAQGVRGLVLRTQLLRPWPPSAVPRSTQSLAGPGRFCRRH